jgi:hypothetical protein
MLPARGFGGRSRTGPRARCDGPGANIGRWPGWPGARPGWSSTTGDRVEPPLDLAASYQDRTVVVWGVLWVDAASVTVEAPDHESVALDIHAVDGWSHPVVADAFPDDHFAGAGEVIVVARDADGREIGRNSTVLQPPG